MTDTTRNRRTFHNPYAVLVAFYCNVALIHVNGQRYEADALVSRKCEMFTDGAQCRHQVGDTGVVSRRNTLANTGEKSLTLSLLAGMPGILGFSDYLTGLAPEPRVRIAIGIAFYKLRRRFITGAVEHLLTPTLPLECREGWIELQLQAPSEDTSLVFVHRLDHHIRSTPAVKLTGDIKQARL